MAKVNKRVKPAIELLFIGDMSQTERILLGPDVRTKKVKE